MAKQAIPEATTALRRTILDDLTPRVREVLELVGRGMTNKEVGRRMSISDQTVKNHMITAIRALTKRGALKGEHSPRARITYLMGLADGMNYAGQGSGEKGT